MYERANAERQQLQLQLAEQRAQKKELFKELTPAEQQQALSEMSEDELESHLGINAMQL